VSYNDTATATDWRSESGCGKGLHGSRRRSRGTRTRVPEWCRHRCPLAARPAPVRRGDELHEKGGALDDVRAGHAGRG
jgi:hypothetical protein